jgi:nucleotide-binding universal stress UspA family protein
MFQHILVATDFSESSRNAVEKALQLARFCKAGLEIIHVVSDLTETWHTDILGPGEQLKWEAQLETNLDLALKDEAYPGVKKSLLYAHSVPEEILRYAVLKGFDLIVCGTHGRGAIGRTLLGSVSQEISGSSSVPVLMTSSRNQVSFESGIRKILVPVDFSSPGKVALDFAIGMKRFFHSELTLLHSIHIPALAETAGLYPGMVMTVRANEDLRLDVVEHLKTIRMESPDLASARIEITTGEPVREILHYTEENEFGCIVMGTHGRRGLERAVLGSVTTNVTAKTKVPVFTIGAGF